MVKDNEKGLLEVKCSSLKIGLTPMKACKDKKFCCKVVDGLVRLKKTHLLLPGARADGGNWTPVVRFCFSDR